MTRNDRRTTAAVAIGITAGFAFLASLFVGINAADAGEKHAAKAAVGQMAPDFTLMDQDGNPVSLADHRGKIVVLEQFNDQCPFVVKFYKEGHMNQFASEAGDDVVWLAIDSSNFSNVEENKAISEEWGIERPLLDDSDGTVGKMYGAKTTPHMYVIDTEGKLVYAGAIDSKKSTNTEDIAGAENYVMKAIEAVRAGETVSPAETKPYGCSVKY
jgi:peroxiredoxin